MRTNLNTLSHFSTTFDYVEVMRFAHELLRRARSEAMDSRSIRFYIGEEYYYLLLGSGHIKVDPFPEKLMGIQILLDLNRNPKEIQIVWTSKK